ncbi:MULTISPECIES: YjhG/YagF family D-xylonate dehydratase [unclassified Brenneria]|uniref:YjhG/YagF family D-xylonate dehydratase n=1 Tax=unclassified Brenneria TaxID=2634434 RepID=UPI0015517CA0|nr:YjhG/YagF family D-xylonate dehydratase [Brenneria sp. hezel4-2-4]MEE3651730.1 YjhG/YagF family D-xylonate dehydratase [Brenneria sp. HEZEL_4_2_4]NPD01686.1 YjhG/YagF family D-xylonate dehydratase [Brenneria sp. hezel4-2-4]
MSINTIFNQDNAQVYDIHTHAAGPQGALPLTPEMLIDSPSGHIFGLTLNAGMGWDPNKLLGSEVLILGTQGGIRDADGTPVALGYHTGHWEIGLQMRAAAEEIALHRGVPFAGYISDPCDGRSQGTTGMFDSLPYRNDAAVVFRRLIRSLPTRKAVIGVATCDKGLPAMMIALASMHSLPTIIVPGGATLPPTHGEDAGKVQTIGARFANHDLTLEEAAMLGCRACASPGGGCQFLGTAGTSQVVAEGLGLALPHSALAPSGQEVWLEIARQSSRAVLTLERKGLTTRDILTDKAIENAMTVHAAFGGSTNLLLHIPAIAHAAGCQIPGVDQWTAINRRVPRLVSVLPNGPVYHPTVRAFLAGGVPEVMLHLRALGLLHEDVLTVTGETLGDNLAWWENSARRQIFRERLQELDGIHPDEVIMSPAQARTRGLTSTITFPVGNIAPEGSVIKSTAIDDSVVGEDGIYRHTGKASVFTSEELAIKAIKQGHVHKGDIMVIIGGGPSGTGMEETYQVTSALKHLPYGKYVSLITDARFSGVSTGACVGHVGPEALVGGPIGKLRDGDMIEIIIDRRELSGSINFIGSEEHPLTPDEAAEVLAKREAHPDLSPHPELPDDTRLWAALQAASGGTWKGCIYDTDKIIEVLQAGVKALNK